MIDNISFAKIVATPTLNSWSQAYNAGKLFAVLSLEKSSEVDSDLDSLSILGKNLFERLEQEFFTLENKDLESIKKAISATFEKIPDGISLSFVAGTFTDKVLYFFTLHNGQVFIKRDKKFGKILSSDSSDPKAITSSSGFVEDNDLIVLTTDVLSEIIPDMIANSNLDNPSDLAESLAPEIHKKDDGRLAAIIIKYTYPQTMDTENILDNEEKVSDETVEIKPGFSLNKYISEVKSRIKIPQFKINLRMNSKRNVFLIITIVIVAVLALSIFSAIKNQNNARTKTLFSQVYPQAQKKYDEGQSLLDLNKNLARDSFLVSQKILQENKGKFPEKSKENQEIQDLLTKVNNGLAQVSPLNKSGLDRSKLSVSVVNGSGIEGTAGKAAALLKELGYNIASTGNADNFNYQGATIKVKDSKNNFLPLLKKDLAKEYTVNSTSSDLPSSSSTDALIIIGK